jgi:very-short-patch-repair endonuclease
MEDSVQGITFRHNLWDSHANARRIAELESELDDARREESKVLAELRSIREKETHLHPPRPGGYAGTLQAIATRLRKEEEAFDWIEDRPGEDQDPPLSTDQFQDLLSMLRDEGLDRWASEGHRGLDPASLASPNAVSALLDRQRQAKAACDEVAAAQRRPAYAALATAPAHARKRVIEELGALLGVVDQVKRHLHAWAESTVLEVLGDHDRAWRELLDVTKEHLSCIAGKARWADETPISWLVERDHHEVTADAEALLRHLEAGGRWGLGPFRAAPAKRGRYLRREVKVGGRPCHTAEVLKDLITWLNVENRLRLLRERWAPFHRVQSRSFSSQVREFEDLCEPLEMALGLHARVARIRAIVQEIPGLPEPTWHDLAALQTLLDTAKAVEKEERLREAEAALARVRGETASQIRSPGADPAGRDLLAALEALDVAAYRDAFSRVSQNHAETIRLKQRDELLLKLRRSAPLLAEELAATARHGSWEIRATHFESAWNWARATSWLERLSDPETEQQLRLRLDSARDRIRKRLNEIAAEKAWAHCFNRMTEHERQHLVAWSKAVRSIGKGTGKYAPMHRRSAREHMNECRSAIPAWVMPLYRVAETIKPGSDLFDVVIIDEASQSGPEALLLAYLAKKLVVVGDDKQISPTYAGINHEDVDQLRARHLADLPHSDAYGVQQSFFDLTEIRYQGRIRLREHFRCMPEIIQFSNNLCYPSEPLIPLRQYGGSRLSPVVSARHVPDGYMKGSGQTWSNPPEAQAIVEEILRMHNDPAYEGKKFGVISLLGEAQAREIESVLLERLGPNEMEGRQLVCGDAYAFQGDERDVIFLSLVSAPSEGRKIGTLTDEAARRRFNVAASRARDQLFLFHTATMNDLSPQCLRYALLQYCQNPRVERQEVAGILLAELRHLAATADRDRLRPPEPFESWFEVDVFLQLATRGYRVLPQHEVAGYRIDLVVEGMRRRIAVECDGDRWHGPDRYEDDMARQRMLERCGWRFWRVRGSAYALDPDGALEDLWETLQRERVYPEGCEPQEEPPSTDLRGALATRSGDVAEVTIGVPTAGVRSSSRIAPHEGLEEKGGSGSRERERPAPLDLEVRPEIMSLADSPYRAWTSTAQLPDPTAARPTELIPGLVEIVGTEGPMSAERLCRIFVKGAGRHRVGRQSRSVLNKALWRALREGLLEERNETGRSGLKERVLRKAGSPSILVRPRGDRDFVEIPPSEVATVMVRLTRQNPNLRDRELYRAVLEFYETRRMTANIEQRLQWIEERREQLV